MVHCCGPYGPLLTFWNRGINASGSLVLLVTYSNLLHLWPWLHSWGSSQILPVGNHESDLKQVQLINSLPSHGFDWNPVTSLSSSPPPPYMFKQQGGLIPSEFSLCFLVGTFFTTKLPFLPAPQLASTGSHSYSIQNLTLLWLSPSGLPLQTSAYPHRHHRSHRLPERLSSLKSNTKIRINHWCLWHLTWASPIKRHRKLLALIIFFQNCILCSLNSQIFIVQIVFYTLRFLNLCRYTTLG